MQLPESLRRKIIHLHVKNGWPSARVAKAVNLKAPMVCKVLHEAQITGVGANEADLLVALYEQAVQ
jgi:hypothetical protein